MRKSNKQKGFTLIELLLVVTLAIGAMGYVIAREFDKAQIAKAETQAGLLDKVNKAMGTYITNNYSQLVNNTPIVGVANIYAPTIAELQALGVLEATFSGSNFYGGGYGTQATLVPTGCVAPNCDVSSLVWITTPVRNANGQTDVSYAAFAAVQLGADGAFSNMGTPGTLAGPNAAWTAANPVGATAGIVAARNGYGSQGFAQFLRRDGSLPMTGSLDMGAKSITNLVSATAGTACLTAGDLARGASGEVLSCQSGTWNSQGSRFWRDPVANFASLPACAAGNAGETRVVMGYATAPKQRLFSCDGTAWGATAVDDNGLMTAGKYMVNDVVTEGTACSPNGLVAKDATGLLLSCQSSAWKKLDTPGQYTFFNASACPAGWVAADGANGTIDLRGEFIRGWDNGRGVDAGRALASSQSASRVAQGGYWGATIQNTESPTTIAQTAYSFGGAYASNAQFGAVRPRNVSLLVCMKL